mmetsp:Transcript_16750/g.28985  ORF Transcript_16750/g.28985 Transcript_16750/m.28985 type:complete len:107 (-) Transcript_16750:404-724(-)
MIDFPYKGAEPSKDDIGVEPKSVGRGLQSVSAFACCSSSAVLLSPSSLSPASFSSTRRFKSPSEEEGLIDAGDGGSGSGGGSPDNELLSGSVTFIGWRLKPGGGAK